MAKLADGIEAIIGKVPIKYLQKLIARKLISAGIGRADEIAPKLLEHYLAGHTEPFSFDHDEPGHEHIAISITDAELSELTQEIEAFFKDKLPTIIQDTSESAADSLLKKLKKNWPNQYAWESAEMSAFRSNLEARWGKALDSLRMLHTICRDIGTEWHRKNRRRKHSHLRNALLRLHVRSCQIAAEIIALLEAGYADGAMARWRTLHEVCIVALVLTDHNEQLAERYIGHRAVEAYRAMEEYERNYTALGFKPLTKREKTSIAREYNKALQKYGHEFGSQYGWAAHHLKLKKPTFSDLEKSVGVGRMRPFYKMASYNVHATAQGAFFKLGLMESSGLIAGASNAGLTDPGQNTAITLTVCTSLLFGRPYSFEDILALAVTGKLQSEIPKLFWRADLKLQRDHKRQMELHSRPRVRGKRVRA